MKYNLKIFLIEILSGYDEYFEVLSNSNKGGYARVKDFETNKTYNFHPKNFNFKSLRDFRELDDNEFMELKEKIYELLNIEYEKQKFELYIKNLQIDGDFSINKLTHNNENRKNIAGLVIAATRKAISKLKNKEINFTTPVKIEMSFKSELDVTNHLYVFKIIEDRLVEKGIIKNDDDTIVKEITLKKHTDGDAAVIVKIKEI